MAWNGSNGDNAEARPQRKRQSTHLSWGAMTWALALAVPFAIVCLILLTMQGGGESDKNPRETRKSGTGAEVSRHTRMSDNGATSENDAESIHGRKAEPFRVDGVMGIAGGDENATKASGLIVNPISDHLSDQVLLMATSAVGNGDDMPPLPNNAFSEKEFRESLKTPVVINSDDPKEVKELKKRVIAARESMMKMLDEGMSVNEILRAHENIVRENAKTRKDAMDELKQIIAEGDIDGAIKYRTMVNLALQQMGIAELTTPITEEERAEQAERRRERLRERRELMEL